MGLKDQQAQKTENTHPRDNAKEFLIFNQSFSFGSAIVEENKGETGKKDTKVGNDNRAEAIETKG